MPDSPNIAFPAQATSMQLQNQQKTTILEDQSNSRPNKLTTAYSFDKPGVRCQHRQQDPANTTVQGCVQESLLIVRQANSKARPRHAAAKSTWRSQDKAMHLRGSLIMLKTLPKCNHTMHVVWQQRQQGFLASSGASRHYTKYSWPWPWGMTDQSGTAAGCMQREGPAANANSTGKNNSVNCNIKK